MKFVAFTLVMLAGAVAQADVIHLPNGGQIDIGSTTVVCGPARRCTEASENAYVACLNRGHAPSSCSRLQGRGCNGGQVACLNRGYAPSTCATIGVSADDCIGAEDNPVVACFDRGHAPSSCRVLDSGCNAGQVACLNRGYAPSTCGR